MRVLSLAATMVLPVWSYQSVVLPLWSYQCGLTTMVLAMWYYRISYCRIV